MIYKYKHVPNLGRVFYMTNPTSCPIHGILK
jgi:hypothetical protein